MTELRLVDQDGDVYDITVIQQGAVRRLVEGQTDKGIEFVDAWIGASLEVLDLDRIVLHLDDLGAFKRAARDLGLSVGEVT